MRLNQANGQSGDDWAYSILSGEYYGHAPAELQASKAGDLLFGCIPLIHDLWGGEKPEGLIHTAAQGERMWNPFRILSLQNLPVFASGVSVPDGARLFKFQ
jgi:hypothetical protein